MSDSSRASSGQDHQAPLTAPRRRHEPPRRDGRPGLLPTPLLIGTHHKAGTVWMLRLFAAVCGRFRMRFVVDVPQPEPSMFDCLLHTHSRFDLERISTPWRGLHLIRDPRDLIVSGCFYHQRAEETWLHERRPEFGGLSYQEKLNSYPAADDRLLFEMENCARFTIADMAAWDYGQDAFYEARYETLLQDQDLAAFGAIFRFLGWPAVALPTLNAIARSNSLFGNARAGAGHVRDGRGGQWREHFRASHRQRFVDLFGDVLVRLGYEQAGADWLDER